MPTTPHTMIRHAAANSTPLQAASRAKPRDAARAVAELMPQIIRGVQLDFFLSRSVTQTQLLVLIAIHAHRRCAMGTLARSLHVAMPTATGIISRLVRAGYVRRLAHPADRRQVMVEVTPRGADFIREFQGVIRRRWEDVLRVLEPRELTAFHGILTKLTKQFHPLS